ncbi:hypothetical protein RclHR1_06400007 [Rhizophagus clarus]|uniref:BTB domain-containing protein n=1 Tax=Rhizophagus clarus TaxID=94130 RepID=A0A2Z6SID2_9GLOM|nr:hypothetical protein RclHR1_06400007 [Rhizophagus clarus]GES97613.1 hypothetical protein GLOIN_2v1472107 [Rhizophagus clarus]
MASGYSLGQDLKFLINNPKYSDVEILCGNEKIILYGCKAILAARSKVFDRLFYNGMKESCEKQISFPTIDFSGMGIILEFIYTGSVEEESLTKDNVIESFNAADYFQLPDLQDHIIKTLKNIFEKNCEENYSPELLSKAIDTMSLSEENLLNLLVEAVAIIPLNTIEFGRLSIKALEYLLSCAYYKEERFFVTPEYELFRYSAILAAKQVSNDVYKALLKRLPTLEQIEQIENLDQVENKLFTYHQKVSEKLEPLIKFIDFRRFKGQVLDNIIEPLKIIPTEIILNASHNNAKLIQFNLNDIQEIPIQVYKFNESDYVWDESTCGSKLIIEDNGKVVSASDDCNSNQSVRSKIELENKGIFEWDIIIEEICAQAWIGVCASEDLNYDENLTEHIGWLICSNGYYYNSTSWPNYCPSFGNGTRITVRLDMNKRTCSFTVNGKRHPELSEWNNNNFPSKFYPVVSLCHPGRIRIESTRNSEKEFWESLKDIL